MPEVVIVTILAFFAALLVVIPAMMVMYRITDSPYTLMWTYARLAYHQIGSAYLEWKLSRVEQKVLKLRKRIEELNEELGEDESEQ